MSEEKLKPCPFCGCKEINVYNMDDYNHVRCARCGGQVSHFEHLPIDAWNTRAESAELAELRAKVVELRDIADHGRKAVNETVAGQLCHQGEFKAYRRVLMLMERFGLTNEKSAE